MPYAKNAICAKMPALRALFEKSNQSGGNILTYQDMGPNTGFKPSVSDPESGSEGRNLIGREYFSPYSVNI
jgi:hypothetical protein